LPFVELSHDQKPDHDDNGKDQAISRLFSPMHVASQAISQSKSVLQFGGMFWSFHGFWALLGSLGRSVRRLRWLRQHRLGLGNPRADQALDRPDVARTQAAQLAQLAPRVMPKRVAALL
jgi:hypothetical protein